MKPWYKLAAIKLVWAVCGCLLFTKKANASTPTLPDELKNYVVIGAFSFEKNAERYTSYAKDLALQANYDINPSRDLFYVYVFVSGEKSVAKQALFQVWDEYPDFHDAWLFQGRLGPDVPAASVLTKDMALAEETSLTAPRSIPSLDNDVNITSDLNQTELLPTAGNNEQLNTPAGIEHEDTQPSAEESTPVETGGLEKRDGFYHFYFNMRHAKRLREVNGRVKIIDAERSKEMKVAKSHEIVTVKEPKNGTNRIKVASDIFGFKKVEYTLDLDDPLNDSTAAFVHIIGDSIIVNFEMERYKRGDVLVMYNVYFFRDAAIMKQESVHELNSLLDMLKENANYKVRIHGHTNGNSYGKIIHLDPEDKNFFSLKGNHKEDFGSAKNLSLYRAYTIQHWLIEQGIAEDRMDIKGWGGKQMIYGKHDSQADKNVRVEIEITAD